MNKFQYIPTMYIQWRFSTMEVSVVVLYFKICLEKRESMSKQKHKVSLVHFKRLTEQN